MKLSPRWLGIWVCALLYPALAPLVMYIPNPMVPDAIIALNMVVLVIAGYLYGPLSGAFAGALGTSVAALLWGSQYDAFAIFPHLLMGACAGWVGQRRGEILPALTILVGHLGNILFYVRFNVFTLTLDTLGTFLLGLTTETMIDIVAIVLLIVLLRQRFYHTERW